MDWKANEWSEKHHSSSFISDNPIDSLKPELYGIVTAINKERWPAVLLYRTWQVHGVLQVLLYPNELRLPSYNNGAMTYSAACPMD